MSYESVAKNSKSHGKKYADEGNYGRAFSHYLVALKLKPEWGPELQEEFSAVLCKWGTMLDKRKRFNDLFTCYEQAVDVFPNDTIILNNLGSHLLRCGLLKEAAHYFRKCLTLQPHFIRARHNLENVSNLAVERWHFRMLNDQHRNEAYREAIIKRIRQGFDRVLDVGTGTGILSLFALEGKARVIYACDSSPIMAEIAEQVFHSNDAFDIKLLKKHSSELQIPGDIREKVSLLVTETFDAGLLGEDILDTLSHAWKHLLLPPPPQPGIMNSSQFGIVIPCGASIYLTGIELDEFANDFHLKPGVGLIENCKVLRRSENYDTHDLSRALFRCLTETKKVFEINFNDPIAITEILRGKTVEISFKCKSSGRLDCFAAWFDLCLDEDIVLNTSPFSKVNSAWDQAIFPLPRSTPVEEDQDIVVTVAFKNKKLSVSAQDSFFGDPTFGLVRNYPSDDVLNVLNSKKLTEALHKISSKLSVEISSSASVLDCYSFPVFGLNFLKDRRNTFRDKLTCFVPTENDKRLVQLLAEKYNLDVDVFLKTETCFEDCLEDNRFDIILLDLVEFNGEIKDGTLLQFDYIRSLLKPGGLILPKESSVIGQFIYSDWLRNASKVVSDSITCGFKIAEYINIYQVRHFIDFDFTSSDSVVCSEPFELFSLLDSNESVFQKTVGRSSGIAHANAMVYWIKIKFTDTCDEILTTGEPTYHQAAILFSKIELPEQINFNIIRNNGLFNIELLDR